MGVGRLSISKASQVPFVGRAPVFLPNSPISARQFSPLPTMADERAPYSFLRREALDFRPLGKSLLLRARPEFTVVDDSLVLRTLQFFDQNPHVNQEADLVTLFWEIGNELPLRVAQSHGFSQPLFEKLSRSLRRSLEGIIRQKSKEDFLLADYFLPENLERMISLAQAFPLSYVQRLLERYRISSRSIWSQFVELAQITDPYERFFYAEMCFHNHWTLKRLHKEIAQKRFHTYTIARQSDERLRRALIELSQGNRREWIYRDLVRFDFLNLEPDQFDKMTEPEFENLMIQNVLAILEEFGDGFRLENQQQSIRYQDPDDDDHAIQEMRLDLLLNVEETSAGGSAYPLIVELKKVPFGKSVLEQCERYLRVFGLRDENGPLYNRTGLSARVMAFVPKANADFITIMKLGLHGDLNISPIFVSVYTYCKPSREFLQKVIGEQLSLSQVRAVREEERRGRLKALFLDDPEPPAREYPSLFFLEVGTSPNADMVPF